MTGRYRINLNSWRTWEPEKRTAKRWSLFVNTCRLLANDGLNYEVTFRLDGDNPHILILASGQVRRRRSRSQCTQRLVPPVKSQDCALRALEAARFAELSAMAEEQLRAELEYWRELELLSGQRQHFKPGLTDAAVWEDDEVAA